MFDRPLVFVDVETTGSSPGRARITEVAALRVQWDADGEPTVSSFSSLINPQQAIPVEIQALTGITPAMVRDQPVFSEISATLHEILEGAVFVAHHARFDYGFIKTEFAQLGISWQAKTLCTVRLSRLLDPDRSPHGLDAVMQRYLLTNHQRHRAMGDAEVLWQLWQAWARRKGLETLLQAARLLLKQPSVPAHLPADLLQRIPHAPGVYRFYGLNTHPLYIGKSIDLRQRVGSHFVADHRSERGMRLASEVRRVDWECTAGELSALLREQQGISAEMPAHNRALRRTNPAFLKITTDSWVISPTVPQPEEKEAQMPAYWFGPFSGRASARRMLLESAQQVQACAATLGLERYGGHGPCFSRQLGKCLGGCVGLETRTQQLARIAASLTSKAWFFWPWPGQRAVLQEISIKDGLCSSFLIDEWQMCDYQFTESAALGLGTLNYDATKPETFNPGLYRLLSESAKQFMNAQAGTQPAASIDSPWLVQWLPVPSQARQPLAAFDVRPPRG